LRTAPTNSLNATANPNVYIDEVGETRTFTTLEPSSLAVLAMVLAGFGWCCARGAPPSAQLLGDPALHLTGE